MTDIKLMGVTIGKIVGFMKSHGGQRTDWYVGVTSDMPRRALEHKLSGPVFQVNLFDADTARAVERHFIEQQHTDGAPGGGDERSMIVYAFMKTPDTDPPLRGR